MKKYRKGVFIVVFYGKKYLLLGRVLHWNGWEFPKAGLKKGEQDKEAVKRELKEETGLKARKIIDFKIKGKFKYAQEYNDRPGILGQTWHLFAVQSSSRRVKIDRREHSSYKWLNFKQAYKLLTWQSQKKCLKLVDKFLRSNKKQVITSFQHTF
ncbi:MAG: NUDIX domain-containing protein [Candidatus Pacearchaeota archaeon]|nr:NUDIX domain-containing protein [Candidatus Pacearchaeota archaeon]